MTPLDECELRCLGCGLVWCRDADVSPGEPELCRDCWETEAPHEVTDYNGRPVCICGDFNCASMDGGAA